MKSKVHSREEQIIQIQKKIERLKLESKEVWKSGGSVSRYEKAITALNLELKRLKKQENVSKELIQEIQY
jgi:hypothetical protein